MDILSEAGIKDRFIHAENRLILLDYDGTLVNYTTVPHTASLPQQISGIIIKLAENPRNHLFIITGRGQEDIDNFLNHIPVSIIAEHGAMVKTGAEWKKQMADDNLWMKSVIQVMKRITETCPGSYVEEKNFSLTWHYRNADPLLGTVRSRELIDLLKIKVDSAELRILDGNKVVEVLSNKTGKGKAVKKLLENYGYDFILSIGDDATDEEMFEFFVDRPNAVTVKVGDGVTYAKYNLDNITDVVSFLKQLSE